MSEPKLIVPPELEHLSTFIDSHIECLSGSSKELRSLALCAAKHIFDWALETEKSSNPHLGVLLATLTEAAPPQTRSQARSTSAQRRNPSPMQKPQKKYDIRETPLLSLFIEGMNIDQIWQQLDLRAARVCESLQALQGEDEDERAELEGENSDDDQSEDEEDDEKMDIDEDEDLWEELSSGEEDGSPAAEGVVDLREESSEDHEDHGPPTSMLDVVRGQQKLNLPGSYFQGRSDLDDGFFDLATFNTETNEAKGASKRKLDFVADEGSAEESEVDLFGSADDAEIHGVNDDLASTKLFYNDFFDPPPGIENGNIKSSKVRFHERVSVKKIKPVGKGMPVSSMSNGDYDEEEESDFGDDSD